MSTSDLVVPPPTSDLVDARSSEEDVITAETDDDIIASAAAYRLGSGRTAKHVSTCRSPDVTPQTGSSRHTM